MRKRNSFSKTDGIQNQVKGKQGGKTDPKDPKKKETHTCNHCQKQGHIEKDCWKKHPELMPEKFKKKNKTEKAGASVKEEDEHLLSTINVDTKDVEYEFYNNACDADVYCNDTNEPFTKIPMTDTKDVIKALVTIELGFKEDNVEDDGPNDVIKPTLQAQTRQTFGLVTQVQQSTQRRTNME